MFRWTYLSALVLLVTPLSGCSPSDPSPSIRARFQQMVSYLCQEDVESCIALADPIYVRAQGSGKVKFQLKILAGLIKLGGLTEADVRIDEVVVADDRKSAEVRFSLQSKGEWKAQHPSKWVLSEGEWYLSF